LVKPIKVGHCGTLDPMATGVLLICLGQATRLTTYLQHREKVYHGVIRLGITTDSDDITGEITAQMTCTPFPEQMLNEQLQKFVGRIMQVPPDVSAVHVAGQRAYDLARKGQEFELSAKQIEIHRITLDDYKHPDLSVTVACGSGTYIRSIARDLGYALGCGATLASLRRTAIGPYILQEARELETLKSSVDIMAAIGSPLPGLAHLQQIMLPAQFLPLLKQGKKLNAFLLKSLEFWQGFADKTEVCLISPDGKQPVGMGEYLADEGTIQPKLVLSDVIHAFSE
jgi:tRNA pseudouridine55 synthase